MGEVGAPEFELIGNGRPARWVTAESVNLKRKLFIQKNNIWGESSIRQV